MRLWRGRRVAPERIVSEAALTLGETLDTGAGLVAIADASRRALGADRATIWTLSADHIVEGVHTTESDPAACARMAEAVRLPAQSLPILCEILAANDRALCVPDTSDHSSRTRSLRVDHGIGAMVGVRLEHATPAGVRVVGVLTVSCRDARPFSSGEVDTARSLGNLAALSLSNARLQAETVEALVLAEIHAETDPLTGIMNRRGLDAVLSTKLAAREGTGRPTSVIVLDLDGLAALNAARGHDTGDAFLKRMATLLESERRSGDEVARLDGGEFAIVLPDTGSDGAWLAAERFRALVGSLETGDITSMTASLGVATAPQHATSAGELLRTADAAMYTAKSLGRNRTALFCAGDADDSAAVKQTGEGYLGSVLALAAALDARDGSTHSHSSTVARYAAGIATELGFDRAAVERVTIAGLLHDVGKVGIPDAILMKPGPLTEAERAEMNRHPEIGGRIIASPGLADVREWVLHHHERPDGCGYPDGFAGEDIPLEARILAVADAYEAMTADRPYRLALPVAVARAELVACAGRQFDRRVVDAFLTYLSRDDDERLGRRGVAEREVGDVQTAA